MTAVNLLPYLSGKQKRPPHETLYWRMGNMMAIRQGDWKLVKTREGRLDTNVEALSDLSDVALYNLAEDIGEQNDLSARHPEKAKALAAAGANGTSVWRSLCGGCASHKVSSAIRLLWEDKRNS